MVKLKIPESHFVATRYEKFSENRRIRAHITPKAVHLYVSFVDNFACYFLRMEILGVDTSQ